MVTLTGTKTAGTYLYINDIRIDSVPIEATEWIYTIEPDSGVNGFKIYTVDLDENRSDPIITTIVELEDNMESIIFEKGQLTEGRKYSEAPTIKNLEFKATYGTDPLTGQSIITIASLQV